MLLKAFQTSKANREGISLQAFANLTLSNRLKSAKLVDLFSLALNQVFRRRLCSSLTSFSLIEIIDSRTFLRVFKRAISLQAFSVVQSTFSSFYRNTIQAIQKAIEQQPLSQYTQNRGLNIVILYLIKRYITLFSILSRPRALFRSALRPTLIISSSKSSSIIYRGSKY